MSYLAIATAVVGVTGVVVGAVQTSKTNKRIKNAMNQRQPFQTSDEVFKIVNASANKAMGDTQTRDFETNQLDRSFSEALGTAETLGAGPNQLSALFGQKMQGIMGVGEASHKSNMEAYGGYLNALGLLANNKDAEQISKDNIWKDYMQSLAKQKTDANATLNNGLNNVIAGASSYGTQQLYKDTNSGGSTTASFGTAGGSTNNADSGVGGPTSSFRGG